MDNRVMLKQVLVALMCVCSVSACAADGARSTSAQGDFQPDSRPLAKTMVYDCNGFEFIARLGPGEMALWLPDRYLILSQVRSASGTKYQEGDIEFWSKADEGILTLGELQYRDCSLQPQRVPWEDARRRGVDFRATGNEPGWYLEIQNGRQLLFVGDYGMQRVVTPDPGANTSADGMRYHAVTEANNLLVEIREQPCADTMSGEIMPSSVTLTLNGRTLEGCGRILDHPWE
jgi:putative lipoprotein